MPSWASYASGTRDLPCPCSRSRENASEVARTRRRATLLPACAARAVVERLSGAPPKRRDAKKPKRARGRRAVERFRVRRKNNNDFARDDSSRRAAHARAERETTATRRFRTREDFENARKNRYGWCVSYIKHFLTRTSSRATRRRRLLFDHPVSRSLRALSSRLAAGGGGAREKRFSPQIRRTSSLSYPRG